MEIKQLPIGRAQHDVIQARSGLGQGGFTLMEVIIVVSLFGIVAGMVFPGIADAWERLAVEGAANQEP